MPKVRSMQAKVGDKIPVEAVFTRATPEQVGDLVWEFNRQNRLRRPGTPYRVKRNNK